ncbi:Peptidyl-prolyl cis-trans isomerase fkbp18, chloroplastic [Asimina triloba]
MGRMAERVRTSNVLSAAAVMASLQSLGKCAIDPLLPSLLQEKQNPPPVFLPILISRRSALLFAVLPLNLIAGTPPSSLARERRSRKNIPLEEYMTSSAEGLKYYDLGEGKGPRADKGSTVQVHFDCLYRGITVVSSRESKLLAGNRIIAQPYEFKVGASPGKERKREFVDNRNGLFSAQAAPKPPPAMYSVTEGMKVGGKRTVIVPPEAGYGKEGMNEIPVIITRGFLASRPGSYIKHVCLLALNLGTAHVKGSVNVQIQSSPAVPCYCSNENEHLKREAARLVWNSATSVMHSFSIGYAICGIQPDATFELNIELLQVIRTSEK